MTERKSRHGHDVVMFAVMVLVGMGFNPMSMLAYRLEHLMLSQTLLYSGLIMASNMVWAHELVALVAHGRVSTAKLLRGVALTALFVWVARSQFGVDERQWMRRMIPHHSTALTTSRRLLLRTDVRAEVRQLAEDIVETQEREIALMQRLLRS